MFGIDTSLFLWLRGLIFCITWREKSGFSKASDAGMFKPKDNDSTNNLVVRNLVFIRHGER